MARPYDRPIVIQKQSLSTELWEDLYKVHARANKASNDNAYLGSGASQSKRSITFEIRYFKSLEDMDKNRQYYRIFYNGEPYNIEDYDDYMFEHKNVKILGVSY